MFDFPASPTVGQTYPSAPLPGQPVYKWTGVVWTTMGTTGAPLPTKTLWTDGTSIMAAQLTLAGDPVSNAGAVDKHYSDGAFSTMAPPAGSVRYDLAQALIAAQQQRARDNMGVVNAFPSGATMLFYQAAAPVGWTQSLGPAQNDKALRVIGGSTGGSSGGTNSFSSVMAQTACGNHTLAASEMPSGITDAGGTGGTTYVYIGGYTGSTQLYLAWSSQGWALPLDDYSGYSGYQAIFQGSAGSYIPYVYGSVTVGKTSNNTGGAAHNHALTMDIQYCDMIVATKN